VDEGLNFIKRSAWKFDIAFLDPPYGKDLSENTLSLIAGSDVMRENGIVVVEHHHKERLLERYQKLQMDDQRTYGSTKVSFFMSVDQ
jgi:16S rRNA G966 N2-methylase RsmD